MKTYEYGRISSGGSFNNLKIFFPDPRNLQWVLERLNRDFQTVKVDSHATISHWESSEPISVVLEVPKVSPVQLAGFVTEMLIESGWEPFSASGIEIHFRHEKEVSYY